MVEGPYYWLNVAGAAAFLTFCGGKEGKPRRGEPATIQGVISNMVKSRSSQGWNS